MASGIMATWIVQRETERSTKMRPARLVLWPFAFLFFLGECIEEFVFRFWIIFNGTAQWTLGDKRALELICEMLEARNKKYKAKLKKKLGGK